MQKQFLPSGMPISSPDSGYQKYGDGTVYATTAEFNQAFADGLGEEDKKVWQTDQKQTAPYLKPFLQEISGDVGRLEAAAGSDFKAGLLAKLQEMTGKTVRLTAKVDPSILGGLRLDLNGTRLDGTVQRRLERLRDSIGSVVL